MSHMLLRSLFSCKPSASGSAVLSSPLTLLFLASMRDQVHILNRMGGVQDDGLPHTGHTSMLEAQRAGAGPRTAQPYYDPAAPYTTMQLQADMGGAGSGVGSIPMYPYGMPVGYGGDGSGSYLGMPGPYSLAPMPTGMHMGGGGYPMMGLPMGYSPAPYGAPYMVPQ